MAITTRNAHAKMVTALCVTSIQSHSSCASANTVTTSFKPDSATRLELQHAKSEQVDPKRVSPERCIGTVVHARLMVWNHYLYFDRLAVHPAATRPRPPQPIVYHRVVTRCDPPQGGRRSAHSKTFLSSEEEERNISASSSINTRDMISKALARAHLVLPTCIPSYTDCVHRLHTPTSLGTTEGHESRSEVCGGAHHFFRPDKRKTDRYGTG